MSLDDRPVPQCPCQGWREARYFPASPAWENFPAPCLAEALMWVLLWKYTLVLLGSESPACTHIPSRRPVCLCKCHCSQLWSTGLPAQQALGLGTKKTVPPFCKELFRVVRLLCCLVGWVFWGGCNDGVFLFGWFFQRSIKPPMRSTDRVSCFLKKPELLILGLTKLQSSLWLVLVQHRNFWMMGHISCDSTSNNSLTHQASLLFYNFYNGFSMYQEKSRKLFLSCFPSQSLFSPLLCIGHWPLFMEKGNNFHGGTQCRVTGLHVMVTLSWLLLTETAGEFSFEELICLHL